MAIPPAHDVSMLIVQQSWLVSDSQSLKWVRSNWSCFGKYLFSYGPNMSDFLFLLSFLSFSPLFPVSSHSFSCQTNFLFFLIYTFQIFADVGLFSTDFHLTRSASLVLYLNPITLVPHYLARWGYVFFLYIYFVFQLIFLSGGS